VAAALALVVAACGGGNDAAAADTAAPGGLEPTTSAADNSPNADGGDEGGNYATVTVGGTIYEVPANALNLCNSLSNLAFGSFATGADGAAAQAGGVDVGFQINFAIPVANWEDEGLQAPLLDVDDRIEGVRWWAATALGKGSVDSWTLEDGKAVGQASFVGEQAGTGNQVGAESGSFELVCR
jgi:hypothetical protein